MCCSVNGYVCLVCCVFDEITNAQYSFVYKKVDNFIIPNQQGDVTHMCVQIKDGVKHGLVLCNEKDNSNYTTEFIHKLYSEEDKGVFNCRMNVLGHMKQVGENKYYNMRYAVFCFLWVCHKTAP